MMIDGNKVGNDWQNRVSDKFIKKGLEVLLLERKGNNNPKCIDFYIHKKSIYDEGFLCEVKSINSMGFDTDISGWISSVDDKFINAISEGDSKGKNVIKKHEYDYGYEKGVNHIEEVLQESIDQYQKSDLSRVHINKGNKPFVVIICFDFVFFASQFRTEIRRLISQYPDISAILMLDSMQDVADFEIYYNEKARIILDQTSLVSFFQ